MVSVAGFHVALCGSGLPGPARRPRLLVGTEELGAFLERIQAGDGVRGDDLFARGTSHRLVLAGNRPRGTLRVELDGRELDDVSVRPARDPDPTIEIRSWEAVRLVRVELEAGR